jgi:protein O-mannosyl-transferase
VNAAPGVASQQASQGHPALWVALLLLLFLGLGLYANSLANDFAVDDKIVIRSDERVRECRWQELLTEDYWPRSRGNGLYRPLTSLSLAANWAIAHEAWAFRLPNVLLHVGAAWMLFLLVRAWTTSFVSAIIAAGWFLIQPIHTAPLNAVVDRAELGAAFFGLLAILLWERDEAASGRRGWAKPIVAAVSFAVAVLFKENALTLAGVPLLLDLSRRGAQPDSQRIGCRRRRVLRCYLPLVLVAVAYLAVRWAVLGGLARPPETIALIDNPVAHPEHGLGPDDSRFLARWGTPLVVFGKAVGLTLWPHPLCWDYSYDSIPTVKHWGDVRLALGAGWLLAAILAMLVSYRRKRLAFIAIGFALLTYSIVSNTAIIISSLFAERYLYLPSVGVAMLVGVFAGSASETLRQGTGAVRRIASLSFLAALAVSTCWYMWLTVDRNRDWRSDRTLDAADLRTNPRSSRLWCAAAKDALNAKEFSEAVRLASRAMEICPDYAEPWKIAGLAFWQTGEADRAESLLGGFIQAGGAGDENAAIAVADLARTRGDYRRAIAVLDHLSAANPRSATAHNNLAWYLLVAEPAELRDGESAVRHARTAITLAPGQGDFIDTYVAAMLATNRRDEAIQELRRLLPGIPVNDQYRDELRQKLAALQLEKGGG